ncbi:alpha/beta hydrolase [Streptomyces sp. NPDC001250]|uniref:alpha/beta fold hydrolase n=1 Tax=unclassified Streptomyces TaxID=2593676 RepID=UPI00331B685C
MTHAVTDVPGLPTGFTGTFESRYLRVNGITVHAVVGGSGPALLLLPGWPQFWYEWRLIMPQLAERFTVIAADLRGQGGSDKPASGYDGATLASDMAELMAQLGHERYAVVGADLGMFVGYVLAADHPDRVTRLVLAEATLPGVPPLPSLLEDRAQNALLWHFAFNSLDEINERMVSGREEIYFGHQFASKAASPTSIPQEAVDVYVSILRDPAALRASFEFYRDTDSPRQLLARVNNGPLPMPVLAIGGERSLGHQVEQTVRAVADDVIGAVLPGAGHYLSEEAPQALLKEIVHFLPA